MPADSVESAGFAYLKAKIYLSISNVARRSASVKAGAGRIDGSRLGGCPMSKQRVQTQALAFGHADHSPRRVVGFLTGEVNRRILADKAAADEVTLIADGPASSVVLADEKMVQRLGRLFRCGACHGR
ncbi:hypothetical protein BFN67_18005 [Pseudaminobacter manganicus]|uniref:Uncharacterized protein n=1 Tax=Manganibacter manganicus TaxID=1873176 RepID=A0A1V8RQT5_9HYPH|nr:hypothetical protein BFN67_18005 [Pseudaminobacter manganicus]